MVGVRRRRGSSCPRLEMQRHYYTAERRFEQSVDVYRPVGGGAGGAGAAVGATNKNKDDDRDDSDNSNSSSNKNNLIVILVVGTAWLGHRPWIYRATSWWNAPGPQTVAAAAPATCVCVRHRGAFFRLPAWNKPVLLYLLAAPVVLGGAWCWVYNETAKQRQTTSDPNLLWTSYYYYYCWVLLLVMALLLLTLYALLQWSARGSASLDDMLHDVAAAVEWVERHKSTLILHADDGPPSPSSSNTTSASRPPTKIVFGGYSSGAHVALTLLSRSSRDVWHKYDLPPPERLFAGILLVSGVLAVEPMAVADDDTLLPDDNNNNEEIKKKSGNNGTPETTRSSHGDSSDDIGVTERTASLSSFSSSDDVTPQDATFSNNSSKSKKKASSSSSSPPPVWLVNTVMRAVWGPEWATTIPSPVKTAAAIPSLTLLPHLVIQNRREVFGLSWLDVFFCAERYCAVLRRRRVPHIFCQVDSDHWFVLASRHLHEAVQEHVPRLLRLAAAASSPSSSAECSGNGNGATASPTSNGECSRNQQANVRKRLEAD